MNDDYNFAGEIMRDDRYPANIIITRDDFLNCGWKSILSGATDHGYSSIWHEFSKAATKAIDEGDLPVGKVLWLLADACSMTLTPDSHNEPFKPVCIMGGRRSVIPDDLSEEDITFFSQIVDDIGDHWLKARIADLVWLKQQPREIRYALVAIDSYRSIPLDNHNWVRGGGLSWKRSIRLCLMVGAGAGNRLKEMEGEIYRAFESATNQDGFFGIWMADLLNRLDPASERKRNIAQKLESMAQEIERVGDLHRSREYFRASANWFSFLNDERKAIEMIVAVAESFVKEGNARINCEQPSHMIAAISFEKAIQTYRTIPRSARAPYQVDKRISELQELLLKSGEMSVGEMRPISSSEVDISEIVEQARNAVSGKTADEAIKAFANLHPSVRVKDLRESAIKRLQEYPLQGLLPATIMSRDGRMIAKNPGMSFGNKTNDGDEDAIRIEMIRDYSLLTSIIVQGDIMPALEILLTEHRIRVDDFITLANNSPIVPVGRAHLFGKALYAGYDRDFITAIHILVPQIENMVRYHLKSAGVKTTTLNEKGIQHEIGLSALMEKPEVEKIFGENLAFEIRSLFCDPFGPNLRNELAHGLVDTSFCFSSSVIYAWWLGLRLVFNAFWNSARKNETDIDPDEKNSD